MFGRTALWYSRDPRFPRSLNATVSLLRMRNSQDPKHPPGGPVEGWSHVTSPRFLCSFAVCLSLFLAGPGANAIVVLKVVEKGSVVPFPHVDGRQISQSSSGLWFLEFQGSSDQGSALFMAISKTPDPKFAGDFHPAFTLVSGDDSSVLASGGGPVRLASFVIDGRAAIELGKSGAWASGWISPVNVPVMVGDEIWSTTQGGLAPSGDTMRIGMTCPCRPAWPPSAEAGL